MDEKQVEQKYNPAENLTPPISDKNQQGKISPLIEKKKFFNKKVIAIIVLVAVVILIGGGAFAYVYYAKGSQKIVKQALQNLSQTKTFEYTGKTEVKLKTTDKEKNSINPSLQGMFNFLQPSGNTPQTFSANFSGAIDKNDPNNLKNSLQINLASGTAPAEKSLLNMETRLIGKNVYLKFSKLGMFGSFLDLSFLNDQWIKIDNQKISDQFGLKNLKEKIDAAQKEEKKQLSPEKIKAIQKLAGQYKIIKLKKLPAETIEGIETYHYRFIINKEELKNFIIAAAKLNEKEGLNNKEIENIDEALKMLKNIEGEIWVGKKDLLPYQIYLKMIIAKEEEKAGGGEFALMLSFKNFNQPIQIEAPKAAKSLEEVLQKMMGGFQLPKMGLEKNPSQLLNLKDTDLDGLTDQQEKALGTNPLKTDSDNDQLSDFEEVKIYKTNPVVPDTDGDGYLDGAEVKAGYNPKGSGKL